MSIKIKLSTGTEVEMREPKVLDMRLVASCSNDTEKEITLISNITGLTSNELDILSLADYKLLQNEMMTFL